MIEAPFGILLAGGLARRMGGGDKSLKEIGGATILARVVATMRPQCRGLVLNANGDASRFAALDLPIVADDVPDFAGPLAGILAGLDWIAAKHPDVTYAVSIPTDTPFLPLDLVARLMAMRFAAAAELACARSGGATHPVVGLWPVAIRTALRAALVDEGIRKIDRFTARFSIAYADWPDAPVDPFFNANAPEDIAAAERLLAASFPCSAEGA